MSIDRDFETPNQGLSGGSDFLGSELEKLPETMLRCARCGTPFEKAISPCLPFCSVRCQQIDLKNWFDESYGFPCEGEDRAEVHPDQLNQQDEEEDPWKD